MTDAPQFRDAEREDMASASSFETDVLCPGRQQLLATLPPEAFQRKPEDDEAAQRGTLIHKARETGDTKDLDADDSEIFQRGLMAEIQCVKDWKAQFEIQDLDAMEGPREERYWLHWPDTLKKAVSAKLDVHYVSKRRANDIRRVLVVEWKSLYCTHLTPAELNWQGRVQAVLTAQEYDAQHVRVVLNKAMFGRTDIVDYSASDLVRARESIFQALWETQQPGAQRRPGDWCNFCPGKPYCREAISHALTLSLMERSARGIVQIAAGSIDNLVDTMPADDLVIVMQRAPVIQKIIDAVKARLKGMAPEQLAALGLRVGKGKKLDPVRNVKGAFDLLRSFGISEAEAWSALKMSKPEMLKAIMRDQGWAKGPAQGWLDTQLEPFIEKQTSEGSLEWIP